MKAFLEQKINWKVVTVTTILFSIFIVVVLPKVSAYTAEVVGGSGSPDTSFFYSGHELYDIAESYGEEGRNNYVLLRWTFDVVWPLVYLSFLVSLCIEMAKPFKNKWFSHLYWLPVLATGFDFLENTLATVFMIGFPAKRYWLGTLVSITSTCKWTLLSVAFMAVLVLMIARIIRLFQSQTSTK